MKTNLLLLFYFGFQPVFSLYGQTAKDRILEESCACMAIHTSNATTVQRLEHHADSCMRQALTEHLGKLMKEDKLDIDNDAQIHKFGEEVARKLFERCAAYRQFWTQKAALQLQEERQASPQTIGIMCRMEQTLDNQVFFVVQVDSSEAKFWWGRAFEGADRFANGLDTFVGKKVQIYWDSAQVYNPRTQQYEQFREVQGMDIVEDKPYAKPTRKQQRVIRKEQKRLRKKRIAEAKARLKKIKKER